MTTESKYTNGGDTWDSVYVTDVNRDEVTSIGWIDDSVIDSMNAKHYAKHGSTLTFTFEGGNMDGATK
jgi:hypothetical protein